MPPNSTRSRLTFGLVGVGRRVERQQRDVVAARQQLDRQRVVARAAAAIHPAAPAVIDRILMTRSRQSRVAVSRREEARTVLETRFRCLFVLHAYVDAAATGPRSETPAPGTGSRRCCPRAAAASSAASSAPGRGSAGRCAPRRPARARNAGLQVIALQTSVGPIASSIFDFGHSTTVTNGNMYSFFAIAASGDSQWTTVGSR